MAQIQLLAPFILKWEGGFSNNPDDLGGATNKGITLATLTMYRKIKGGVTPSVVDLQNISNEEWTDVLKMIFWDKWLADNIKNQSVANMLVDWVWTSGSYGIKIPQSLIGVDIDGIVGQDTLNAVNMADANALFQKLKIARLQYINRICVSHPSNLKFKQGWIDRIDNLTFSL
jgi:lysozyme family protein